MKEFKIKQLSASNYKLIRGSKTHLVLHDDYLTYSAWSEGEILDEATELWVEKKFNNNVFAPKSSISTIEYYWAGKTENWSLKISMSGSDTEIFLDFEVKEECDNMYHELIKWKTNGSTTN